MSDKEIENPFPQEGYGLQYSLFEVLKSTPKTSRSVDWILREIETRGLIYPKPLVLEVKNYFKVTVEAGEKIFDRVDVDGYGQCFTYRIHESRWPRETSKWKKKISKMCGWIGVGWEWFVDRVWPVINK